MNEETVNQETLETTAEEPERTFTQTELDAIVRDRLQRERNKYADFETYKEKAEKYDAAEEAQKSELQKVTERADTLQKQLDAMLKADSVRKIREQVSTTTGVPANLLTGETEDDCKAQAEAIMSFAKPTGYPYIRDAGEVRNIKSGSTREQFADWFKTINGG